MGLFYSLINDLIENNEINESVQHTIQQPCGQSGCCSSIPHMKQQTFNSPSTLLNIAPRNNSIYPTQTNTGLSTNNSHISHTSSTKRNQRRVISKNNSQTRSRKSKHSRSSHYSILSKDEERLLEYVLDAYIAYKGSQDLMAKSLAEKLNTDIIKMNILCRTLCQLIEAKTR